MHVTFSFAFSSRYAKTRTSDFRKVVQQHTKGMTESIICILFEIYFSFQQWKNFENRLRNDKVIAMSLVYYFLGTQRMWNADRQTDRQTDRWTDPFTMTKLIWPDRPGRAKKVCLPKLVRVWSETAALGAVFLYLTWIWPGWQDTVLTAMTTVDLV